MRTAAAAHTPDAEWFASTVSCNSACPVHTDAAAYVQAVANGRLADAYDLARAHNPFPSICGRVCSAPCERACRRQVIDAPIAIRALKRVVSAHFGVEAMTASRWHRAHGPVVPVTGASIGIVGGGPAGLAAAYELRLAGHAVTVYEGDREAGGMLLTGIPAFRLPRTVVREEIAALLSIGIELVTECRIGVDRSMDALRATHDALLLTVGSPRGRTLRIDGSEFPNVWRAVDMLRAFNAAAYADLESPVTVSGPSSTATLNGLALKGSVLLIGGGSVAFDAARAAVRATRGPVTLIASEAYESLPVPRGELHEAALEGVVVRAGMGVRRIVGEGVAQRVIVAPVASLYDAAGRFSPSLQDGRDESIEVGAVVVAIGQESDLSFLDPSLGIPTAPWGGVMVDSDGRTPQPRLYAAGDVSTGPRDLIDAIAAGQRVARTIHADCTSSASQTPRSGDATAPLALQRDATLPGTPRTLPLRRVDSERRYWNGYDAIPRRELPMLPTAARAYEDEVEKLLALVDARVEASRCLHCNVHIMLDAGRCVACGLCVDVCPYACIALSPAAVPTLRDDEQVTTFALTLDERACIRCGLCVDRCPTDALMLAGS